MIKTYYLLTKPGIVTGNLITTSSAFIFACKGQINYLLFFWTVLGLFAVIASACVLNNCIDREADGKMARTKNRPLVVGGISIRQALLFSFILASLGFWVLWAHTNFWATLAAFLGFFIYAGLYSFWKYHHATAIFIGSIAGAMPPVVGYCAASSKLDLGALLVFTILVLWQMPHFFSIAIYRAKEYSKASIPIYPETEGIFVTKVHMLCYVALFFAASLLPVIYGMSGIFYAACILPFILCWLILSILGFKTANNLTWARQMFVCSLVIIMILSLTLSLDSLYF